MLQGIHANSFCSRTIRLWNPLPAECFLLTYDKSWVTVFSLEFIYIIQISSLIIQIFQMFLFAFTFLLKLHILLCLASRICSEPKEELFLTNWKRPNFYLTYFKNN